MNAICFIADVIFARICYKIAKRIEESRESRIRLIYDAFPIDEMLIYRLMSDIFKDIKPKAKDNEVEADK